MMEANKEYMISILSIEREGIKKVRKDMTIWKDMKEMVSFFFDNLFTQTTGEAYKALSPMPVAEITNILNDFKDIYDENDDKDVWFDKVKQVAAKNGYATDMKVYKAHPEEYKGSVADVAKVLRIFVTGKEQSPDLHAVMQVMGKDRVMKRLNVE